MPVMMVRSVLSRVPGRAYTIPLAVRLTDRLGPGGFVVAVEWPPARAGPGRAALPRGGRGRDSA